MCGCVGSKRDKQAVRKRYLLSRPKHASRVQQKDGDSLGTSMDTGGAQVNGRKGNSALRGRWDETQVGVSGCDECQESVPGTGAGRSNSAFAFLTPYLGFSKYL